MPEAFRSIVLEDTSSTNTEAFARAAAGEAGPLWVMARRQTRGRGRSGRTWTSDPGNLYASLLQRLSCPQAVVHQISLLAGVAVMDAVRSVAGAHPLAGLRLKWPNDVLIGGAKCAGILPESQQGGPDGVIVVVGIGINLSSHPDAIGRPATHLAANGVDVSPDRMLPVLAAHMAGWLQRWDLGRGFQQIVEAWLERAGPLGEQVSVHTGNERILGRFMGLEAASGALLLRDQSGNDRRITFGDVSIGISEEGQG